MRPTIQLILRTLLCLALLAANTPDASAFVRSESSAKPERALYLNPTTGRFWTRDSYEGSQSDPLSLHKYLYCAGNPVNESDPTGHDGDLASLNITMMQMTVLALKTYNVTVNLKAAVENFSNGITAMQEGRDFAASLDIAMGCLNATFAISSALAPLPPGGGAALAGAGSRTQAIRAITANPALEKWYIENAVKYVNSTGVGLFGIFMAMEQEESASSRGQPGQGSASSGPQFVEPDNMRIGFMTRDGKLIGKLAHSKVGHEMLASQLAAC